MTKKITQKKEPDIQDRSISAVIPVIFTLKGMDADKSTITESSHIGETGIVVLSPLQVKPSQMVDINLFLPENPHSPDTINVIRFTAQATSSTVKKRYLHREFSISFTFTDLDEQKRKIIKVYMDFLLSKQSPEKTQEKRKAARVPSSLQALLFNPELDIKELVYGEVVNISSSGLYFLSNHHLPVTSLLQLRIFLPNSSIAGRTNSVPWSLYDGEEQLITCQGNIVRQKNSKKKYGVGIHFTSIADVDKTAIDTFVSRAVLT